MEQHRRDDLVSGLRSGRYTHGDDPVTVDMVTGTLFATFRRIVSDPGGIDADTIPDVVSRLLEAIGID